MCRYRIAVVPQKFVRIHRHRIVNISRVTAAHYLFGGAYELELHDGGRLSTGRQYRGAVQNLIGR
jgi:two-component system LytT family response regulator